MASRLEHATARLDDAEQSQLSEPPVRILVPSPQRQPSLPTGRVMVVMVEEEPRPAWRKWARRAIKVIVVAAVLLLVAAILFYPQKSEKLTELLLWVQQHPIRGFLAFLLLYIVCTVAFVPVTLLAIAAGAVFGMWVGASLVWLGALVGETLAFLIGRFLLRGWVKKAARKHQVWRALEAALKEEGWKVVLLLRMAPILPFALLNYAMGSSAVKFPSFFVASSLGVIPGICMHVYLGTLVKDISTIHSASSAPPIARLVVLVVSLLSCVVALVSSTMVARHALLQRLKAIQESELGHQLLNDDDDDREVPPHGLLAPYASGGATPHHGDAPSALHPVAHLWPFQMRRTKSLGDDAAAGRGSSDVDQGGSVVVTVAGGGRGGISSGGDVGGAGAGKGYVKAVSEAGVAGGKEACTGWPITQPPLSSGPWWPGQQSAASDPEAEELTPLGDAAASSAGSLHGGLPRDASLGQPRQAHGSGSGAISTAADAAAAAADAAAGTRIGAHDAASGTRGGKQAPAAGDSSASTSSVLAGSGSWPPARALGPLVQGNFPGPPAQ